MEPSSVFLADGIPCHEQNSKFLKVCTYPQAVLGRLPPDLPPIVCALFLDLSQLLNQQVKLFLAWKHILTPANVSRSLSCETCRGGGVKSCKWERRTVGHTQWLFSAEQRVENGIHLFLSLSQCSRASISHCDLFALPGCTFQTHQILNSRAIV